MFRKRYVFIRVFEPNFGKSKVHLTLIVTVQRLRGPHGSKRTPMSIK